MEDEKIIGLYHARDEAAIAETDIKYGGLCRSIAGNILKSPEDREETVNDTYFGLWNAIPPEKPRRFPVFIGKITRNLALKRFDYLTAAKRSEACVTSLEELAECVSGAPSPESELENRRIEAAISAFLEGQSPDKRQVFLRRYWYFDSIGAICRRTGYSPAKVTSMLRHMRQKLKEHLEKEDIDL